MPKKKGKSRSRSKKGKKRSKSKKSKKRVSKTRRGFPETGGEDNVYGGSMRTAETGGEDYSINEVDGEDGGGIAVIEASKTKRGRKSKSKKGKKKSGSKSKSKSEKRGRKTKSKKGKGKKKSKSRSKSKNKDKKKKKKKKKGSEEGEEKEGEDYRLIEIEYDALKKRQAEADKKEEERLKAEEEERRRLEEAERKRIEYEEKLQKMKPWVGLLEELYSELHEDEEEYDEDEEFEGEIDELPEIDFRDIVEKESAIFNFRDTGHDELSPAQLARKIRNDYENKIPKCILTKHDIKVLYNLFKLLDFKNKGFMGKKGILMTYRCLGYEPKPNELKNDLQSVHRRAKSKVTFVEYLKLIGNKMEAREDVEGLHFLFKSITGMKRKTISIRELCQASCRVNNRLEKEEAIRMFKAADKNKDKLVDFEEFCALMSKVNFFI